MICKIYKKSECKEGELKYQPGDFILTHGTNLFDRLIQLMTQSHWNHTALIIDEDGAIVELVEQGIKKHNISKYAGTEYFIVQTRFSKEDRKEIAGYAHFMLKKHAKYGFLQIESVAFKILTKS